MIFVTVGTHEQPFNRLVEYVDNLKSENLIDDEVIIQTGFSTHEPKHCSWSKLYPYKEVVRLVSKAEIVITHGGPSSFIMPLQLGKIPIVVPRQKQFGEHVNNHQVEFARAVAERQGNIIAVEKIEDLKDIILNYNSIVKSMNASHTSNNLRFNQKLSEIVDEMMK